MGGARKAIAGWLLLAIGFAGGCGGYGKVSPAAAEYAKAVYGLANRRAAGQIEPCAEKIAAAHQAGELTDDEARWLEAMLDDARAGDWGAAASGARELLAAQVEGAP